jgi:hypothetical protein
VNSSLGIAATLHNTQVLGALDRLFDFQLGFRSVDALSQQLHHLLDVSEFSIEGKAL